MPRFFEEVSSTTSPFEISGESASHIIKSLRMKAGEKITLCDKGVDYLCEIMSLDKDFLTLSVIESNQNITEPDIDVTLFQGYPKGDKLENIVQKSVELGVSKIVPVVMARSISRPDEKSAVKKRARLQKIAKEACGQSQRGKIVEVSEQIGYDKAITLFEEYDLVLLCYEGGGSPVSSLSFEKGTKVALVIGPEGGFDETEVEKALEKGAKIITLGKRILRCETAPICALSVIMYESGNLQ